MSTVNLTVPHYGKDTVYVATVFSSTSYVFSLHAVVVDMNKRLFTSYSVYCQYFKQLQYKIQKIFLTHVFAWQTHNLYYYYNTI